MRMLPFWRGKRDEEYENGDGVGGRDFEWLGENSQRRSLSELG